MTADHAGQTGGEREPWRDECEHPDVWFDRVVCPDPCGGMHEYCTECGHAVRGCLNEPSRPVPVAGQVAREAEQSPAVRLMQQVASNGGPYLHPRSVMVVLRALADYTALQDAVAYRRTEPDGDDPALAVGRWLHSVADELWRDL